MKRGTDHKWDIVKYKGDMAIYARCKCGFEYNCGRPNHTQDGSFSLTQIPTIIYRYCPICGAKKKLYNGTPIKLDKFQYEE